MWGATQQRAAHPVRVAYHAAGVGHEVAVRRELEQPAITLALVGDAHLRARQRIVLLAKLVGGNLQLVQRDAQLLDDLGHQRVVEVRPLAQPGEAGERRIGLPMQEILDRSHGCSSITRITPLGSGGGDSGR